MKSVKINKDLLFPYVIYNQPFKYDDSITLHPVVMKDILTFQTLSQSIIIRKNSTFHEKQIIKMSYLEFLIYCFGNDNIEEKYKISGLSQYYILAMYLLKLCCPDAEITINEQNGYYIINNEIITPQIFDDLRRIIIIQNDIDFDIDDFLNYDTEQRLLKAQKDNNKSLKSANMEDYIDSLVIAMNTTEKQIMDMTIRKFWRYIKRYQLFEIYHIMKTGECSGMVSFKEPIEYWMLGFDDNDDKYSSLKSDEQSMTNKINNANS